MVVGVGHVRPFVGPVDVVTELGAENGVDVEILVREVAAQAQDVLGPRVADVGDVVGVDHAVPVRIQESDVPGLGVGLQHLAVKVEVTVDVVLALENAVRFVADEVSHRVAFCHPCDGGVAHRPTPTIQESGFSGHIDDEVSEVGVVQGVAELPVALASAVGDGQVHPAVADFTEVGRGVVRGTDVPRDDLGHQQVLRGALVDVGFDGQLVLEQAEFQTEVNLLAFLPLHVGVGRGGEGGALVQDLVLCAKRVAEDVFDAGHVAERGDAV